MRVVSLACSNTEIVCALGAADLLVGVDDHSDYPDEVVRRLPRVGPDLSVDIDKIAALGPDLVLASLTVPGHERNVAALRERGLPFLAPEPSCLADVYENIRIIGEKLGRAAQADALIGDMQSQITPVPSDRRPRVLVEWWPKPVIVPGRLSWVTELIEFAGGENPLAGRDVKSTPLSDDELRELNPDAVVISWCGVRPEKYRSEIVERRPALKGSKALRHGCVFAVSEAFLGRPGPRLSEGFRALTDIVARSRERAG